MKASTKLKYIKLKSTYVIIQDIEISGNHEITLATCNCMYYM